MAKIAMTVDCSKVLSGLDLANAEVKAAATQGMGRAMLQLKADVVMQKPTAPIKEGFLRGSASVYVQEEEIRVPLGPGERGDKKATGYTPKLQTGKILGFIGFNVPYAARWHEVPAHFSEPSAGNKYLESKLVNNKFLYMKIILNSIKGALNKGVAK